MRLHKFVINSLVSFLNMQKPPASPAGGRKEAFTFSQVLVGISLRS